MAALLALTATLLLLPLSLAAVIARAAGCTRHGKSLALPMAFAVAPTVIGMLTAALFAVGAGREPRLIVLALAVGSAAAALALRHGIAALAMAECDAWRREPLPGWPWLALALGLAALLGLQTTTLPLLENDALEYVAVARHVLGQGTLAAYPVTTADPTTGLYAPAMHPPAFHMAIAWGIALSTGESLLVLRLLTLLAAAATLWLVWRLAAGCGPIARAGAVVLLASVPLWVQMAAACNADAFRIASFAAAFAATVLAIGQADTRSAATAGALAGIAMWSHSIGVLALPSAVACILLLPSAALHRRIRLALVVAGAAAAVGCIWYVINAWRHGVPLGDSWPVAEAPSLLHDEDLRRRRGLATFDGLLRNGALRCFLELPLFGLGFWLAAVAAGAALLRWRRAPDVVRAGVLFLATFAAVVAATLAAGSTLAVKNPRYALTLAPVVALLGGWLVARLATSPARRRVALIVLALAAFWSVLGSLIRLASFADPVAVLRGDERAALSRPRFAGAPLLAAIDRELPAGGRVLTFRQAELTLYGRRPWLDHYDPATLAAHLSADGRRAHAVLRRQDVGFVLVPWYTPATLAHGAVAAVLADPALAEPHGRHRGMTLYRIADTPEPRSCRAEPFAGRGVLLRTRAGLGPLLSELTGLPQIERVLPAPAADRRTVEVAGGSQPVIELAWAARETARLELPLAAPGPGGRFVLHVAVSGIGLYAIDAVSGTPDGGRSVERLWDAIASPRPEVAVQWMQAPGHRLAAIGVTSLDAASGRLLLSRFALCAVEQP